jgi:hypothetical protein
MSNVDRHDDNESKFKELVLYIAQKSMDDSTYGATKLNKLLCFSDFMSYGASGRPITGMDYQKLEWGPAPRRLKPLQRDLINDGSAQLITAAYGYPQARLVALRDPDLSLFSGPEIAIVDGVLEKLKHLNATSISDYSHKWFSGWDAAGIGETIPYETVFWHRPELTDDVIDEGRRIAKNHGLLGNAAS